MYLNVLLSTHYLSTFGMVLVEIAILGFVLFAFSRSIGWKMYQQLMGKKKGPTRTYMRTRREKVYS